MNRRRLFHRHSIAAFRRAAFARHYPPARFRRPRLELDLDVDARRQL